jgi:hypothetical protein
MAARRTKNRLVGCNCLLSYYCCLEGTSVVIRLMQTN